MEEDSRKPSHISYKDYQKKVTKNPNEGIIIFVSTFFILLLLFLGIAKQISPEVDVSIGDENSDTQTEEVDKTAVDGRLKLLQDEDSQTANKADNTFADELDEKVVLPDKKAENQAINNNNVSETPVTLADQAANPKPAETSSPAPKQVTPRPQASANAKVVVGYYSTKEQAEVAKGIIAESGLNISPFVRNIGGAYTIQIGSYATREKAQSVVNDLLRNNYPARIITE